MPIVLTSITFDTGLGLLGAMLRRAGDLLPTVTDPTGADHLIDAQLYLQKAYLEICGLKPWRWARKRVQFTSHGRLEQNATSITNIAQDNQPGPDTASVVTVDVAPSVSVAGRKFFMTSDGIPYRIASHTAGANTFTLQTEYTGSSSSGNCMIFQDELFVASDILSFPVITELHWGDEIIVVTENEGLQEFPRNIYGAPRAMYGAWLAMDTLRIMPWTFDDRLFECSYNKRPDAFTFDGNAVTDAPIVPQEFRLSILQRALTLLYSDKRDARLPNAQRELSETLSSMSTAEATFSKARMHLPRGFRVAP